MEIKMKRTPDDFLSVLRGGALLWSTYFLLMAMIDALVTVPDSLPGAYFLFYGGVIVLVPLLTFLPRLPARLGRAFPLLILSLMGLLPFIGEALILSRNAVQSWVNIQASQSVYTRQWLLMFLTAALAAYGYRWPFVIGFVALLTGVNILVAALRFPPEALPIAIELAGLAGGLIAVVLVGVNLILQRLQLRETDLRVANEQLLALAATMDDLATSRERNRMARDLHDTLAHSLSGLIIQLETVEAYWDEDPQVAQDLLEQAVGTARTGLHETRRALKALRASPLEDLGLLLALKDLAETAAQRGTLELSTKLPQQLPHLANRTEQCIYRVAQEATTNAVLHAHARRLDLWLTQTNDRITLNIHDDGVGFDPNMISHPGHYGIPGMMERARVAGGSLTVQSQPGQGTAICLDLPVHKR